MRTLSATSRSGTAIITIALAMLSTAAGAQPLTEGAPVSFQLEVLPVLQNACAECHQPGGEGYAVSGLDLRTYEGLMNGTKYGPIVIPGDPFTSNLMVLLEGRADPEIQMPRHRGPLRRGYINVIRRWISEGAKNN